MTTELFDPTGRVYATLAYDATNKWVVCTWLGAQSKMNVLQGSNACIALLQQHACGCLLNDSRQLIGVWSDKATELLYAHWAPRGIEAGLTHVATVAYPDSAAALYAEFMELNLAGRLHMRLFHHLAPAQQWLHACQAC